MDRLNGGIHLVLGGGIADGEAHRAFRVGAQRLVCQRGTVQSAAGQDTILLLQLKCDLGVILPQKIHRNDTDPSFGIDRTRYADMGIAAQPVKETIGQSHFPLMQSVGSHLH